MTKKSIKIAVARCPAFFFVVVVDICSFPSNFLFSFIRFKIFGVSEFGRCFINSPPDRFYTINIMKKNEKRKTNVEEKCTKWNIFRMIGVSFLDILYFTVRRRRRSNSNNNLQNRLFVSICASVWVNTRNNSSKFPFCSHFPPFKVFQLNLWGRINCWRRRRRKRNTETKNVKRRNGSTFVAVYASQSFFQHHLIKLYTFPFPSLSPSHSLPLSDFLLFCGEIWFECFNSGCWEDESEQKQQQKLIKLLIATRKITQCWENAWS